MNEHKGERRCCEYCWRPYAPRGGEDSWQHNDGCPIKHDDPTAMEKWERGRAYGFADNIIHSWQAGYYSTTFLFGFRVGKAEIESLIGDIMDAC